MCMFAVAVRNSFSRTTLPACLIAVARAASSDGPKDRPALADLPPELAPVRQAFDLIRKGKYEEATALQGSIADPVARKLVEWMLLRNADCEAGFDRYVAFMATHPSWPNIGMFRRRAEAALWQEHRDLVLVDVLLVFLGPAR